MLNGLSIVYSGLGLYKEAVKCLKEAMSVIRRCDTKDRNLKLAALYQNMGATLNFSQDYDEAIKSLTEAIVLYGKSV